MLFQEENGGQEAFCSMKVLQASTRIGLNKQQEGIYQEGSCISYRMVIVLKYELLPFQVIDGSSCNALYHLSVQLTVLSSHGLHPSCPL